MTREEAIERIKNRYDKWTLNDKDLEAITSFIPELAESKNERIRKEIISFIEYADCRGSIPDDWHQVKRPGVWLDYLEKQKEQKPIECIKFDNEFENQVSHLLVSVLNGEHEYNESFVKYAAQSLLEYAKNELKPTEWDDDDVHTRFAFYTYENEPEVLYLSNVFVEETSRNKGLGTKILNAAEKVAETIGTKSIRLKVKQDSPANAWYRKHGYDYMTFEDGYDWLEKTLEYLKPAKQELSEDDKTNGWTGVDLERYLSCLRRLGTGNPQQPETINSKWFKEHCRPQPHWKPSEEQMEALRTVIIKARFGEDGLTRHIARALESLNNDLMNI